MTRIAPPHRVLMTLLGIGDNPLSAPPVFVGYPVARRVLAGLLGVKLSMPSSEIVASTDGAWSNFGAPEVSTSWERQAKHRRLWSVGDTTRIVIGIAAFVLLIVLPIAVVLNKGLAAASLWTSVVSLPLAVVAAAAAVWVMTASRSKGIPPPELMVPDWVVDRPTETSEVIAALLDDRRTVRQISVGLHGAAGFGKSTIARMACADRRVQRHFKGGIYLVTIGRDLRGTAAIADKVNNVIRLIDGEGTTFTDPDLAGLRLGTLLDAGPRRLLVLDDVWAMEQIAPFLFGGRRRALLITTRIPELLEGIGRMVRVDRMSNGQARSVLTSGLPPLEPNLIIELLDATGRWPLLLRLVNKILADAALTGADTPAAARRLLTQLREGGPALVDDLFGSAVGSLRLDQPQERIRSVRATIQASTSLLSSENAQRFAELGIFAEEETIPLALAARMWQATADLGELQSAQLIHRLSDLGLVTYLSVGVILHDVVRDYLRSELGTHRLASLNGLLLDAVAADVATAAPLGVVPFEPEAAWWELGPHERYMRDHLVEHLLDAGRHSSAEATASDLRWVGSRLLESGPAAPAADLSRVGTSLASRLQAVLNRAAHLLAPTEPTMALIDVLHSRVAEDPDWGAQVAALRDFYPPPRLINRWAPPDLADHALRRVLISHNGWVAAVAVAPDGTWLAIGSADGTVTLWEATTGQKRAVLKGSGLISALAVAPDGTWLASGSDDGAVRIWDVSSGRERAVLTGHSGPVNAVAIAPDGSWLASGSEDHTIRTWNSITGREKAVFTGHQDWVKAVAVAPDGTWLASGSDDGTVRIWDVSSGRERAVLTGHSGPVNAVAIAPDGTWMLTGAAAGTATLWDSRTWEPKVLPGAHDGPVNAVAVAPDGTWVVTGSYDQTARIWDIGNGRQRAMLTGHNGPVNAVAVAPDGTWVVTGSYDQTARIWDPAARQDRITSAVRNDWVRTVAVAPDGTWVVSGSDDQTVRIWDVGSGRQRAMLTGHDGPVNAVAVAPDGTWVVSGSDDQTVRIWDVGSGRQRAMLTGHDGPVNAVAVAPDGTWVVSGSDDQTVRIWDVGSGRQRAMLTGHDGPVNAVAVAPDGTWVVSGSDDQTAGIWRTVTGQRLAVLNGHTGWVNAVAVAPDGTWVVTASYDQTARIWNPVTGEQRGVLTGHNSWLSTVAVTADGTWLATGGDDATIRIWDTATAAVCSMMRMENIIFTSAWLETERLIVGGPAGIYLFDFISSSLMIDDGKVDHESADSIEVQAPEAP